MPSPVIAVMADPATFFKIAISPFFARKTHTCWNWSARSILSYWATDQLGIAQSQLAEKLNVTQSAISHAARRGKSLVKNKPYSIFEEEFS